MTTSYRPRAGVWSRKGLVVDPPHPQPFADGWALLTVRVARVAVSLTHEHALSLRDWLSHHLDDTPAPADPDAVRAAVDEQIEELRRLAAESTDGGYQTAMAWAQRSLNKVAEAAGRKRTS